jgi:hypothetical protein
VKLTEHAFILRFRSTAESLGSDRTKDNSEDDQVSVLGAINPKWRSKEKDDGEVE